MQFFNAYNILYIVCNILNHIYIYITIGFIIELNIQ